VGCATSFKRASGKCRFRIPSGYNGGVIPPFGGRQKSAWLGEEVKSDSRDARFVIANHSPERLLQTGLRIEALEKTAANGRDAAHRAIFSRPVCWGNTAKSPRFSPIKGATQQSFSAVQTVWRREVDSNSQSGFKLLGKVLFVSDLRWFYPRTERSGETN